MFYVILPIDGCYTALSTGTLFHIDPFVFQLQTFFTGWFSRIPACDGRLPVLHPWNFQSFPVAKYSVELRIFQNCPSNRMSVFLFCSWVSEQASNIWALPWLNTQLMNWIFTPKEIVRANCADKSERQTWAIRHDTTWHNMTWHLHDWICSGDNPN